MADGTFGLCAHRSNQRDAPASEQCVSALRREQNRPASLAFLAQQGRARNPLFSRANSTAFFRISASIVFLPSMRCNWPIWARAAVSLLAGTTDSPVVTAVSSPSRSRLRQIEQQAGADAVLARHQRHAHAWLIRLAHQ